MTAAVPPPGAHGGDGARVAAALGLRPAEVLDLSASLNPCAPPVAPLVARHLDVLGRYPDESEATEALATVLGVPSDRVVLTNGGAEAIALVAAERPHGRVDDPDFALYRHHLALVDHAGARWRSNPHNPTGVLAAPDEVADVWDEAFWPLATGTWTRGDACAVVLGSLTKLFACPGLRIGYVVAPDAAFAERLRRRQPRWAVNGLALAVLPELLAAAELRRWAASIAELRDALVATLRRHGYEPSPSSANFVLVPDAPGLRDRLARRAVVVRDTASFGLADGVRIAVPDEAGLERLHLALGGAR